MAGHPKKTRESSTFNLSTGSGRMAARFAISAVSAANPKKGKRMISEAISTNPQKSTKAAVGSPMLDISQPSRGRVQRTRPRARG